MIVLDTHVWIWWVSNPELLSAKAREAIDHAIPDKHIYISSISVWELALLVERGRLKLSMDTLSWLAKSESLPFVTFIPVNNSIAFRSTQLRGRLHNDPADRIIIATTLTIGGVLISKDLKIRGYKHVKTLW